MNRQWLSIMVICFLVSCGNRQEANDKPTVVDSVVAGTQVDSTPEITSETYAGILPCADCAGIQTELTLKSDNSWSMHVIYDKRPAKGPGSNEMSENGSWMLHGTDTVHLVGRKDAPSMYIRTDSSLIQLDMQGKRIEGKLASKYVLKKM